MDMLQAIRAFAQLPSVGSFTTAAQELDLVTSQVSRAKPILNALEHSPLKQDTACGIDRSRGAVSLSRGSDSQHLAEARRSMGIECRASGTLRLA